MAWRRIDNSWLGAVEEFALRMSNYVNNTSLVLAFELPESKRVCLFVGDAQRGNWASWKDNKWTRSEGLAAGEEIDSDDLLARTVLYKVGHHGSHNATLRAGGLQKMGLGARDRELVAMLPANEHWAKHVKHHPWQHPLDAIYDELVEKTRGRIFQSDIDRIKKPPANACRPPSGTGSRRKSSRTISSSSTRSRILESLDCWFKLVG